MPARARPPLVLAAFATLVLLVVFASSLLSYPARPAAVDGADAGSAADANAAAVPLRPVVDVVASKLAAAAKSADALHLAAHSLSPPRASLSPSNSLPFPSPIPTPSNPPPLPTPALCARTLLYRFHGTRGLASEFLRFVRTVAVAERWGYEVFVLREGEGRVDEEGEGEGEREETGWMYGSFEDYFLPPPNRTCSLPPSAPSYAQRRKMLPLRSESHVADAYHIPYTSALLLSAFSPTSSPSSPHSPLRALHTHELSTYPPRLPLPASETVPRELAPAFRAMSAVARRWWRLEAGLEAEVLAVEGALGLREREAEEEEEEGVRTVGLHLRLGDKCREAANVKYSPLRFAPDALLEALKTRGVVRNGGRADECARGAAEGEGEAEAEAELVREQDAAVLARAVRAASVDDDGEASARPATIFAMSDDPRGVPALRRAWAAPAPGAPALDDVLTRVIDLAEEGARVVGLNADADERAENDGEGGVLRTTGFDATAFREAPLAQRIALTRPFLRDLTLLSRRADVLVLSQASNVGRLLTLLAGEDMVRQGRVHSVDVRWFATAYYA
ncbi:hypothetical protein DMC30DRAFT_415576 [Rhodotorula diobovata]|uniref:GDP-fucose protein O-fucosyltransferase-domain-containing protein n=1 Tax=Rhodotorula diobovata TaxID=5288 RepID=A0A5C5G0E6_9BASI|nr:hypothetical protein DMC30DRAFT_415576 [Rhodotorula diobovata]